jgi:putative transcriptional regulator
MTICRHLSDETLLRLAAGTLDPGLALVARAHLESCPECRAALAAFEEIGGAFLDEMEAAPIAAGALALALAAIEAEEGAPSLPPRAAAAPPPAAVDGIVLPAPLSGFAVGPRRWVAPGVHSRRLAVPEAGATRVAVIELAPGVAVPEHSHEGVEMTLVLRGSYSDGLGRCRQGDVMEADEEIAHSSRVDSNESCICLVAFTGRARPRSLLARLYQSVIDI